MIRLACSLFMVATGAAAQMPPPIMMDGARIQNLTYIADRVVPLQAAPGFAVVVELADDERIENVVIGNGTGWQVTANQRGDHLIVKPGEGAAATNLVVTSDIRRYVFLLESTKLTPTTPFVMHFVYPTPAGQTPLGQGPVRAGAAQSTSSTYKLRGDRSLFPAAISDDGQRTTVSWSRTTPMPAMYAVDGQGHEALVNGRMVGSNYVMEGVSSAFVFRLGKAHATATRLTPRASR